MKIEKVDLKVVHIGLGSVSRISHVGTFASYWSGKETRTFYTGVRLTKDGNPPKNGANYNWADEARWDRDGNRRGDYAEFNAEREVLANKARERIAELEAALERAEDELHAIYAGPKPEPKP